MCTGLIDEGIIVFEHFFVPTNFDSFISNFLESEALEKLSSIVWI